jgi:hypothetical protein
VTNETLAAVALLAERDMEVTITVRAKDLLPELEARFGGPEIVGTRAAARQFGYHHKYWERAARAGEVPGAFQEAENGSWRLPADGCRAHLREKQDGGSPGRRRRRGPRQTAE